VNEDGFYLMDEPDAPLSFTASLGLAALLHDLVVYWRQFLNNPQSFFPHLLAEPDVAEPGTADPPAAQA
jgi:predicted ATPase